MAKYVVRVELNGSPSSAVYEDLHDKMSQAGFERYIKSDKKVWYALPHATYIGEMATTRTSEVVDHLAPIVKGLWADREIIVFRYEHASWRDLTAVS